MKLTNTEKLQLLQIARTVIRKHLSHGKDTVNDFYEPEGMLNASCGAFVSLYIKGKLRGCMGTFSESDPLYKNTQRMALAAASSDQRFKSIGKEELAELDIEISVLSPRERIYNPDDIILGKHGIYIVKEGHRGTLLPQVALDQNWNVEEFLGHCSKYKAGLEWEEWQSAEIYTYEATVFKSIDD